MILQEKKSTGPDTWFHLWLRLLASVSFSSLDPNTATLCACSVSSVMSSALQLYGREFTRLFCPWDSPGKNTRVGCHALLQGISPTQRLNPGLPHCGQILYHLSQQGSWRVLEWVANPFSRGSSQHRNQTRVSCITDRFFTVWATREAQLESYSFPNKDQRMWMYIG